MILSKIKIDIMNISDLENIKNILCSDFDEFWNYEIFKQELANNNSKYFILKYDDEIIGFAGYKLICSEANIMNIVIKKDKRNLGIGKYFFDRLLDLIKKENCNSITLEVNENNLPAINLYLSFNFKKIGLRKKYYNKTDNALIMTLYL